MSCSNRALRLKFSDPFPRLQSVRHCFCFCSWKIVRKFNSTNSETTNGHIRCQQHSQLFIFPSLFNIWSDFRSALSVVAWIQAHDQAHNGVHFAANAGVRHSRQKDLAPFDRPHSDHSNQHEQLSMVYDYSGHGKQAYHHGWQHWRLQEWLFVDDIQMAPRWMPEAWIEFSSFAKAGRMILLPLTAHGPRGLTFADRHPRTSSHGAASSDCLSWIGSLESAHSNRPPRIGQLRLPLTDRLPWIGSHGSASDEPAPWIDPHTSTSLDQLPWIGPLGSARLEH